jgi:hypothetical protein
MSKVYLKYAISSLDPNIPFHDGNEWTGDDAVLYASYRKEVLEPLSYMYYGQAAYANSVHRLIQLSFANTAIAMEYHAKRRQSNSAIAIAVYNRRLEKANAGESAPFETSVTLTDENGTVTTL